MSTSVAAGSDESTSDQTRERRVHTDQRIGSIDGLRGIAILGVIVVHCSAVLAGASIQLGPVDVTRLLISPGKYGVELFFVLSGLTLTLSLERRLGREQYVFRSYFVRRLFRLSPLYYVVLACTALAGYNNQLETGTTNPSASPLNYAIHIAYAHGLSPEYARSILGVTWSLTPEVVFYLLLPAIITYTSTRKRIALFAAALLGSVLWLKFGRMLLASSQTNAIWISLSPPALLFVFLAGVLMAPVYRQHNAYIATRSEERSRHGDAILLVALIGFFSSHYFGVLVPILPWLMISLGVLAYCLGSALMEAVLSIRPLRLLGTISYSAFLVHYPIVEYIVPVMASLADRLPSWLLYSAFVTAVGLTTVLISAITYRFIERPGIALGDLLIGRYLGPRQAVEAR